MNTLVIERQAVRQNAAAIKEEAGSAAVCAVLAADAYGAGLTEMAGLLRGEGISRFAVSESSEAAELREAGFVDEEILMLRSTTDREELERLMDLGVVCTIGSYDTGVALNALAEARATVAEAYLQADTGTGLGGFLAGEPDKILAMYRYLPSVAISGIYTRLSGSRAGNRAARTQAGEFQTVIKNIHEAGFETGMVYIAAPYPFLHRGFDAPDGILAADASVLGRGRGKKDDGLCRVGYGEAALCEVRWLPKGHPAGSEAPVVLKRPARVAVLPIGYQNGFGVTGRQNGELLNALRSWWSGRRKTVRIGGQTARVIGRIGAMETTIDVTDLKCGVGDIAVFEIDPLYARGLKREYR